MSKLYYTVSDAAQLQPALPQLMLSSTSLNRKWEFEVQRELKGTGTLHTNMNQKQVEVRGLQLEPMKCEAGFKIRPRHFTLIQQHYDSYRCCLKGSKMTTQESDLLRGAAWFTALTISGPVWRGHVEFKRGEASVCTLHQSGSVVHKCRALHTESIFYAINYLRKFIMVLLLQSALI